MKVLLKKIKTAVSAPLPIARGKCSHPWNINSALKNIHTL